MTKARPLFEGHYQPILPADLGFYDLRYPESVLPKPHSEGAYGIEAFCYWHCWFAGRRFAREIHQGGLGGAAHAHERDDLAPAESVGTMNAHSRKAPPPIVGSCPPRAQSDP